jgi:conjugal transfer pilus assembly protein TrbC
MRKRVLIFTMLVGLLVDSSVHGTENSCTEAGVPEATKALVDEAKELATTMIIPENKHKEEGEKRAEESNALYRSQKFQDKVKGYETCEGLVPGAKKTKKKIEPKSIFADSEKIYLFLSSSLPDASLQGYMASLDGLTEIVPVMQGMVGGMQDQEKMADWYNKVLKNDLTCQDTVNEQCTRYQVAIKINPTLFDKYNISEVPALVYTNGDEILQIQGDVGIVALLDRVNQEAKSPGITGLIAKIRESR